MTARDITEIGNIAVVGPAALAGILLLWLRWARALSSALAIEILAVFVATVLLKEVSRAIGGAFFATDFMLSEAAPSGHMAMSCAVYGGVALICGLRGRGAIRVLVPVVAAVAILVVGVTRVLVRAHTPADVIAALVVAILPLSLLLHRVRSLPENDIPPLWPFAATVFATVLGAYLVGLRYNSPGL